MYYGFFGALEERGQFGNGGVLLEVGGEEGVVFGSPGGRLFWRRGKGVWALLLWRDARVVIGSWQGLGDAEPSMAPNPGKWGLAGAWL